MIIFLLVFIFLAILWPGLIRTTLLGLLVIGLLSIHAKAAPTHGSCSGKLVRIQGEYMIQTGREGICVFNELGRIGVSSICSEGNNCKVKGQLMIARILENAQK